LTVWLSGHLLTRNGEGMPGGESRHTGGFARGWGDGL